MTGCDPGEILAITLGNVREDSANQRVYKGDIDTAQGPQRKANGANGGTLAGNLGGLGRLADAVPGSFAESVPVSKRTRNAFEPG